jgi:predicted RNase H-like HicB family nuclease
MAKLAFTIIVESGPENYSAYAPDLPGCVATGDTVEETIEQMKEAIAYHLEGLAEDGLPIPQPSDTVRSIEVELPAA